MKAPPRVHLRSARSRVRVHALPQLGPDILRTFVRRRTPSIQPFPLGLPGSMTFAMARSGIYRAVRELGLANGATVLMPAYHHGVEVEAVRAAGARVRFYGVLDDFRVDPEEVIRAAARHGARAVYVTHFAGVPQPVDDVSRFCRAHELALIEDCALAFLSADMDGRPLGREGDAAVFCLYKTLPLPDGAVLWLKNQPLAAPPPPAAAIPALSRAAKSFVRTFAARHEWASSLVGPSLQDLARSLGRRSPSTDCEPHSQHLRPSHLAVGMSRPSAGLLPAMPFTAIASSRRRNYHRLLRLLGDDRASAAGVLPPGACPLFLPLRVGDKDRAVERLAGHGVETIDFWRYGDPLVPEGAFPTVDRLRRTVLEVPIHQDLDANAMELVARACKDALRHAH